MRLAAILAALLLAAPAAGHVPQTILVDGVNDFSASNQVEDDSNDTQGGFCTPPGQPMDIGIVYMTNDANNLYIGFTYNKRCFTGNNLGVAIDVGTAGGGTTDPFGRKIAWTNVPFKPDFVAYSVVDNGYQALYQWSGTLWNTVTAGNNVLGWVNNSGFEEVALSLVTLGATPGTVLHLEWWMTQEGTSKGPLDAVRSDDVQLSTTEGTTFDVTVPVEMTAMYSYTVLNVVDTVPPVLSSACVGDWDINDDGVLETSSTKVDVRFNEPVQLASSQTASNYTVTRGATTFTVSSAVRDPIQTELVHLTLSSVVGADAAFTRVRVQNVRDVTNNIIVNNGTTNVREFFIKRLRFEGNMKFYMRSHGEAPDTFTVEGSYFPVSWDLCDNARLSDANADSIYTGEISFCVPKNAQSGQAIQTLEWKFVHACGTYESIGNRLYTMNAADGPLDTLAVYWDDNAPENFTSHAIDVVFVVDANAFNPGAGDVVALAGNQPPLSFDLPSAFPLADDGAGFDDVADDGIYTRKVRFAASTFKTVDFKYTFNEVFECTGQGNRNVWLNDAAFDTVGGPLGPIVLPVGALDRCTVTSHAVKVVFKVDMNHFVPPGSVVALNGSALPLTFDIPPLVASRMKDDGVAPDQTAGDKIYTLAATFPDSTALNVEYKYVLDDQYECSGQANRTFGIDDVNYSVAIPQVLALDYFDCRFVGVGDATAPPVVSLEQNAPNPFNPLTTIRFAVEARGAVALRVYGPGGRLVATLVDGPMERGSYSVMWDGRDNTGQAVPSGVYFYEITAGDVRSARRMVLLK